MKQTSIIRAIISGIGIGIPVTLVCMALLGGFNPVVREFLIWTVASALYGLITQLVFGSERFSVPLALGLHCAGCVIITAAAVMLCGYTQNPGHFLSAILPVFLVVYIAVSAVCFLYAKWEAKKINAALEQK